MVNYVKQCNAYMLKLFQLSKYTSIQFFARLLSEEILHCLLSEALHVIGHRKFYILNVLGAWLALLGMCSKYFFLHAINEL